MQGKPSLLPPRPSPVSDLPRGAVSKWSPLQAVPACAAFRDPSGSGLGWRSRLLFDSEEARPGGERPTRAGSSDPAFGIPRSELRASEPAPPPYRS